MIWIVPIVGNCSLLKPSGLLRMASFTWYQLSQFRGWIFSGHAYVYTSNGCEESAPGISAKMHLYRTLEILVSEHFSGGWFVRLLTLKAPIETGDTAIWILIFVRKLAALMAANFWRGKLN
jgi:hypothetical protein